VMRMHDGIGGRVREELLELLVELVRIPSPNPPGDEDRVAEFALHYLVESDIDAQRVPLEDGRSSVVGRVQGQGTGSIVLCGHLDTVAVHEEKWSVPPFSGRLVGDRVYGRGAADMKGGVAAILRAARWIVETGRRLRKSLVVALTADEEGGYRGARSLVEGGYLDDAEFLLIAEPTGGAVFLGQKGELWIRASFSGRAAHGSVPELGANAVLPACQFGLAVVEGVEALPTWPEGRTSVNLGRLAGGWQVNVVPDKAEVELDVRWVRTEDRERVLRIVEEAGRDAATRWRVGFEYLVTNDRQAIVVPTEAPYVAELIAAVTTVTGRKPQVGIAPYSTDAVEIVPRLKIPVAIYGPGSIAQAHQPDEYVELSSVVEAFEGLVRFLELSLRPWS